MARGRFISRCISQSRKFAALERDTHRLMYLLILPHADREGRHSADPLDLAGLCFTRLRYSEEEITAGLEDLARVGLITRYAVDGAPYLEITGFFDHNTPHAREPASVIPAPPRDPTLATDEQTLSTPKAVHEQTLSTPKAAEVEEEEKRSKEEVEVEEKKVVAPEVEEKDATTTVENLLKSKLGPHYDAMLTDLPAREKAWLALNLDRARALIAASQEPNDLSDRRSFRTRLKDNLDAATGLANNPSGGARAPTFAELAARQAAVRAEEDALWEGLTEEERAESERRAAEFLERLGRGRERFAKFPEGKAGPAN
jgi:hypothetical protein